MKGMPRKEAALADVHEGEGGHKGGDFQVHMAQADSQAAEHTGPHGDDRPHQAQIGAELAVEHQAGEEGAGHAHRAVNGEVDTPQHNDEGQAQGHHQGQRHLVEDVQQVPPADKAETAGGGEHGHQDNEHKDGGQLHQPVVSVFAADFFGELLGNARRRVQSYHKRLSNLTLAGSRTLYSAERKPGTGTSIPAPMSFVYTGYALCPAVSFSPPCTNRSG